VLALLRERYVVIPVRLFDVHGTAFDQFKQCQKINDNGMTFFTRMLTSAAVPRYLRKAGLECVL